MLRFLPLVLLIPALHAQSFEAASVRPAAPLSKEDRPATHGGPGTSDPERISYRGIALMDLIMQVYQLQALQLSIPDQFRFKLRYDIVAKIPPGTTPTRFNIMMQNLLADRFGMKFHRQPKQFDAYKLTVAKGGPKLKATQFDPVVNYQDPQSRVHSEADGTSIVAGISKLSPRDGRYMMSAGDITTANLAHLLEGWFRSPVTDATGSTAKYDVRMEFSPEGLPGLSIPPRSAEAPDSPSTPAPNIFEALEKQLGLKLEKSTATLDMLIVDHLAEVPTEN